MRPHRQTERHTYGKDVEEKLCKEAVQPISEQFAKREIIKFLKEYFKKFGKEDAVFDERNIGNSQIKIFSSMTTIAVNLATIISAGNIEGKILMNLLSSK